MKYAWALVGAALTMAACHSNPQKTETPDANWAGHMQGLAGEVREMIPFIYSRQAFSDPNNTLKIKAGLKQFAKQAHRISPEMGKAFFGQDPIVAYSLEGLQEDLTRADEAFSMGQTEYARTVAKSATNHCFRCHSVSSTSGTAHWDVSQISTLSLQPLERVDLMVASRREEEAEKFLESLLADHEYVVNFPFDFEAALRKYMSLMIRKENSPERPLKELDRVLEMKGVPYYVAEQARAWRSSLLEWRRQMNRKTGKDALKSARSHISRAIEIQQFARDHAGDIEYLRATALLHDFLRSTPKPKGLADAYFLLGQSYEVLDELGDWNLHEIYYESCVRTLPHSELARKCYGRLEASVYLGFSGSSGVHVPANEAERLARLKELSL